MNITSFKKILPAMMRNKIPVFLWGSQGIGKTQSVGQFCKENDLNLITLYTATQEPGDLIGLLVKDDENKTAYHTRPSWFPTSGQGIIFLDELNRAPRDVIQCLFSFVQNGVLHTHRLPEGWYVMAAGNYQSDRFTTTDTSDAAWLSRFCHIDFVPTVEEFLVFAEDKNMFDVAAFVRQQPSMLELSAKDAGRMDVKIVPDRRAWIDGVGRLEIDNSLPEALRYEVYAGLVGVGAAAAYISHKSSNDKPLHLGEILHRYSNGPRDRVIALMQDSKAKRFDLLNQPLDELLTKLEINPHYLTGAGMLDNLKLYLLDIPRELSTKVFTKMSELTFTGKKNILNDPEYVRKFT